MPSVVRFVREKDSLTLAAAVVVGAAVQDVVVSLVDDIIAPPVNAYTGGLMSGELVLPAPGARALNRKSANAIVIRYGKLLSTLLKLLIVLYTAVTFARSSTWLLDKFFS